MKLYSCSVCDTGEFNDVLVVANNKEEAEKKVKKMDWSHYEYAIISEVDEIDGYKIIITKV